VQSLLDSARFLARPDRLFGGKNVWKYLLRALFLYPWASRWARYLLADEQGRVLLAARPRLLLKLQRPYLRGRACVAQRLHWLIQHYSWARTHWPWQFTEALYSDGERQLALVQGASDEYRLLLRPTDKCDREGELILALERDGATLALVSFAIHRHGHDWVANIGCLQGPPADVGREAVKAATQDLHGLRPKQAVLTALYGLARCSGIRRIHAVSNSGHIHRARWRSRGNIQACYDSFWTEMGGEPRGDSFWLPEQLARKTMLDIPSRKRAQYRRRHALEDSLIAQIADALPAGCSDHAVFVASQHVAAANGTLQPADFGGLSLAA
jgi:uncharacterized protein VirK/YbjX